MITMKVKCPYCHWKGSRQKKHAAFLLRALCPKCACYLMATKIKVTQSREVSKREEEKTS